ncbi:hypothetical protein [Paenibacillus oceani]|uniref:Uncharacterized protein n=1 Tax=Paenibacillus oceani TaxID=2772510 RepID=A0A927C447_9BACL|nr:hypothetical protein [Paenibacillus oceani]MBD2860469.1 hypothetical protein [Paenibacillus oceani]
MVKQEPERKHAALLLVLLAGGLLSLSVSLLYLSGFGFSFDFLGPEKGSESSSVELWSVINMGASFMTIAFSVGQLMRYNPGHVRLLMGFAPTSGMLHVPPLLLWLAIGGDSFGVMLHAAALLVLLGGLAGLIRSRNQGPAAAD